MFRESGDPLSKLLESLDAFASGRVRHDVAVALAQEGQRLVRRGFDQSKAPDGSPWRPLSAATTRGRPRRPLRKTDQLALRASHYTVDARGFVMESTSYGSFHQSEAPRTRLPRRPFYPDESGLSLGWSIALTAAADEAMAEHLPR